MVSYTLYQLGFNPDPKKPMSFAPHVWKTLLPFRVLNLEYNSVFVTIPELREVLPRKFEVPKVTLPTLIVAEDDGTERIIMDSFNIALYLEETYSTPTLSLFAPGGNSSRDNVLAGQSHARFMEHWVDKCLAHEIRPCVVHTSYAHFPESGPNSDLKSRQAFLDKVGQSRMDELVALNGDAEWCEQQYAATRKQLSIIDTMLRERSERGEHGSFLAGVKPTQSDFCVFAFFPYSRTNTDLTLNTWLHPSLPFVNKWVTTFFETGLVKEDELVPLVREKAVNGF